MKVSIASFLVLFSLCSLPSYAHRMGGIFAHSQEESETILLEAVPQTEEGAPQWIPSGEFRAQLIEALEDETPTSKKDQPAVVGRIVKKVPFEYVDAGYELSLGNRIGGGAVFSFRPFAVLDVSAGLRMLPAGASFLGDKTTSEFTVGLRATLLNDRLEVGMALDSMNRDYLTSEYISQFKQLGYDVRVSVIEFPSPFSDPKRPGPKGGKLFLAISGFKKDSFITPSLIGLGLRINLALQHGENKK